MVLMQSQKDRSSIDFTEPGSFPFLRPQAPESYKNVTDVVNTCHDAGISKKAIKLRPIAVIKG